MSIKALVYEEIQITNPKQYADLSARSDQRLFPYYAGYSTAFAERLLSSVKTGKRLHVLDPWNGGGTTVHAANSLGLNATGVDLNPVMVIVAKAGLLSPLESPSLEPLARSILERVPEELVSSDPDEPMRVWFQNDSANEIRRIECVINRTFVSHFGYLPLNAPGNLDRISPLAAFFYVALFRTVRRLLATFIPSNPTWVRRPGSAHNKKRPSREAIYDLFLKEVIQLSGALSALPLPSVEAENNAQVSLGSSERLPLGANEVDIVVSSPPYCTRIDYAIATSIELGVLRFSSMEFDALRRSLMGGSTVGINVPDPAEVWGNTCLNFLARVHDHPSKASKTYYFKSHVQYFDSLYRSISEISRVLRSSGACVLVVQDSHYKEIHNDVPRICVEMASECGLKLRRKENFASVRSMVAINRRAKKYLAVRRNVESVLCFEKE